MLFNSVTKILTLCSALIYSSLTFAHTDTQVVDIIKHLPKTELHLHLGGSYPIEYLQTIATPEQIVALNEGLDRLSCGIQYQDAFFVFGLVSAIINTEQKVEDGTYALCKAMQHDNVEYIEIRTGLKNMGSGYQAYLEAVLKGIERGRTENFNAKVLLSLQRNASVEYARATIDLACAYKDCGVVGIDISGDSTLGTIDPILPIILETKAVGLKIALHIGESQLETDQIRLLTILEPERVGHAVHLTPEAAAWIHEHATPIEVCLTSAQCTGMVQTYIDHPGLVLYKQGHPIIICTDDPLIFRTTLSKEFALFNKVGFSLDDVMHVINTARAYAF